MEMQDLLWECGVYYSKQALDILKKCPAEVKVQKKIAGESEKNPPITLPVDSEKGDKLEFASKSKKLSS